MAAAAGADAFGMIFAPSPRRVPADRVSEIARLNLHIVAVGVFVNPELDEISAMRALFPTMCVQLSGNESPSFVRSVGGPVIKAIHVDGGDAAAFERICDRYAPALPLFDTHVAGMYGGTGTTFDWSALAPLARARALAIAGGLTPENVGDCVRAVRPFGVDVRSGTESGGRKDAAKMEAFVKAVREADAA